MREAERCTDVTNAVVGEADGAARVRSLAPPLKGARSGAAWARGIGDLRRDAEFTERSRGGS
jgi:hypothetical protein